MSALAGKRIVVTRAPHQAAELNELLVAWGAKPISYPCIDIIPPEDTDPLDAAIRGVADGEYDLVVLTSANAAHIWAARNAILKIPVERLNDTLFACVGSSTAAAAEELIGVDVGLVASEYVAEALVDELADIIDPGDHVLLPQADIARPILRDQLTAMGATVNAVAAYRTILGSGGVALRPLLASGRIDAITLTSASAVRNLLRRLAGEGGGKQDLSGVCTVCIGPVTADAALDDGIPEYTLRAMVAALARYLDEM
jgi:uroporphyrinogen-III synthase